MIHQQLPSISTRRAIAFAFVSLMLASAGQAQTFFNMGSGNYTENFDDIANTSAWPGGFNGTSSAEWRGLALGGTGTIPTPTRLTISTNTAFSTGATGGVHRGTMNLMLLSSGATDNSSSVAVELYLDFAGRYAGTLSFDAATVFNSSGDRLTTLRVYASVDGSSFTEVTGTNLPYTAKNNVAGSASITNVALPSVLSRAATCRLRFYCHNGGTPAGTSGSRPKISIDNLVVTSTPAPTITGAATATSFTTTYGSAATAQSFPISGTGLIADVTATAPTGFEVANDGSTFGPTTSFTQTSGNASGTLSVRLAATAAVTGDYNAKNIVLSSTDAPPVNITTAASGNAVAPKALTITGITAQNKTYDGSATATLAGTAAYDGLVDGETFSVMGTPVANFPAATVGLGLNVTVTGYAVPTSNYSVTQPTATANISTAPLSITANDVRKTPGTTITGGPGFTLFTSSGLINPETIGSVTVAYGSGSQAADPEGVYPDQVVPSAATGGTFNSANYDITYAPGDLNVSFPPTITLTGTLSAVPTVYGTASPTPTSFTASGSALTGNLTVTPPAGYEVSLSPGSGYGPTVTLTAVGNAVADTPVYLRLAAATAVGTYSGNVTVSGGDAPPQTLATVPSEVSAKPVTITGITAADKTYDSTTRATLAGTATLVGVETSDLANVTLGGTVVALFASAAKADDIAVTVTGYTLSGTKAGNYSLSQPTGLMADITARELTLTNPAVTTKPYDGTTTATITGTLTNVVGMDDVTLIATGSFADANVGTGIAVTSTATLSGTKAGNYSLTQPTGLTGTIIKAVQTLTFAALPVKLTTDAHFALTASSSSGLTVTYTSSVADVATLSGNTATINGPGTTYLTASQAGNSNYAAATALVRALAVVTPGGPVAIPLVENGSYLQDFDSMGTTTGSTAPVDYPLGWTGYKVAGSDALAIGDTIVNQAGAGDGTGTSGGIYNFGTTMDRALGSLATDSLTAAFGASFINLTGTTVEGSNLQLGFSAEQWRQSNTPAHEAWVFEWKIGGNVNDSSGWNTTPSFNINEVLTAAAEAAAVDGNLPANRVVIPPAVFSSLTGWQAGQLLHIRWRDTDDTGSDAAMAIDDFTLTLTGVQPPTPKAYWDANGNTAGAGGPSPAGTWDTDLFWNSGSAGMNVPTGWTAGYDAVFAAGTDATGSYTVTLTGTQDVGAISLEEGNPTLLGGTLNFSDLSPVLEIATGSSLTIDSVISGSGGLLKQGAGALTLQGLNTFTGNLIIDSGSVSISSDSHLGATTNDILFNGGKLLTSASVTLNSQRTLSGSVALAPTLSTTLTLSSALSTTGLDLSGVGTLNLLGAANNLGSLLLSDAGSITGNPTSLTDITIGFTTGSSSISNNLAFGNTNRTIDIPSADASLTLSGALTLGGGNRLIKTGAGTLSLTGVNTSLNKLSLGLQTAVPTDGGTIIFGNKNALGTSQISLNYGTLFATTNLTGANAIAPGFSIAGRAASPVILDGADLEFLGNSTLADESGTSGKIRIEVSNHTILSGTLSGAYGAASLTAFTIGGDGTFTLAGAATGLTTPLDLVGEVTVELNTGVIGSASATTAVIHSLAANTTLAPGTLSSTRLVTLHGGLNGAPDSVLHLNITGTTRGTEFDAVDLALINGVAGAITFAGKIVVALDPGFIPADEQSFDVLNWDASVTPDFTGIDFTQLPALGGDLVWDTRDFETMGVLRIRSTTPRTKFVLPSQSASESDGTIDVEVILTNLPVLAPGQVVTVPFTVAGTAAIGLDYTISTVPVRFGPGEMSQVISIQIKPDTLQAGAALGEFATETLVITLGNPVGASGVFRGLTNQTHTLSITDHHVTPRSDTSLADQSSIVTAGTPVEFNFVPVGSAPLKLQWLKNGGATLGAALTVTSGQEQTLSIVSASLTSAGKYSTKISNLLLPAGLVSSTTAELVVVERLAEYAAPRLTLGKALSPLPLVANAAGTGLVYRWQLNGDDILDTNTNYSGAGTKTLVIKSMSRDREGTYQCIVRSTVPALAGVTQGATAYRVRQAETPVIDAASVSNVLPPATVGATYQAPNGFQAPFLASTEDRQSPVSWRAVGLPLGLSISPTGVISGNPDVEIVIPTTYNVTLSATNPAGTVSAPFTLLVNPVNPNSIGKFIALADRSGSFINNTGTLDLGARIDFTTTVKGYLTGKLFVGTTSYPFPKTRINNNIPLAPTATVLIKRKAPLTNLTLNLIIDATNNTVSGSITDASTSVNLSGYRSIWNTRAVSLTKSATTSGSTTVTTLSTAKLATGLYVIGLGIPLGTTVASITNGTTFVLSAPATATTLPTKPITLKADFGARHFEGRYNFGLDLPTGAPADRPQGTGYGSFKITTAGTLSIVGKTSDGQAITGAAFVGAGGQVAVYKVLYATKQRGSLFGTIDIDEGSFGLADNDINAATSTLDWMRPSDPAATAREYPSGFTTAVEVFGGSYLPPVAPNLILGLTGPGRARLVFAEGGIAARNNPPLPAPDVSLNVNLLNKLLLDTGTTTTLTASASTGAFSGGFTLTDDNPRTTAPVTPLVIVRKTTFQGLMIREGSEVIGYGYFKLPQLPADPTVSTPGTTPTTSQILSGMVVLEKTQ